MGELQGALTGSDAPDSIPPSSPLGTHNGLATMKDILDLPPIGLEKAKPLHGCPHAEPPCFFAKARRGAVGGILDWRTQCAIARTLFVLSLTLAILAVPVAAD